MKRNLEALEPNATAAHADGCSKGGCSCGRRGFLRKGVLAAGVAAVGSTCKLVVSVRYRTAPMDIQGCDRWRANRPQEKISISQKTVSHISHVALVYLGKREICG